MCVSQQVNPTTNNKSSAYLGSETDGHIDSCTDWYRRTHGWPRQSEVIFVSDALLYVCMYVCLCIYLLKCKSIYIDMYILGTKRGSLRKWERFRYMVEQHISKSFDHSILSWDFKWLWIRHSSAYDYPFVSDSNQYDLSDLLLKL